MKTLYVALLATALTACGGGGGGSSDSSNQLIIEGSLRQGASETVHQTAHGANEPIGEVQVCANEGCSITDSDGRFGFAIAKVSGELLLTIDGHGITDTLVVTVPEGADELFLELENHGGDVHAHE